MACLGSFLSRDVNPPNPPNFENSTKYGNVGQVDKLIAGKDMITSSRSVGSNCRAWNFWVQDVYTEHELP
jgi:hypothetical protein